MRFSLAIVPIIASFHLLGVCKVVLADELTKEEIAARDYCYQGVGIGMKETEFLRLYPLAKRQESGKWNVTAWYARRDNGHCVIQAECYQGQVFYVGVTLYRNVLFKMGGRSVLEQKLTETLGLPNSVEGSTAYWNFAKVDRQVGYRQTVDGGAMLLILDTAVDRHRRAEQTSGSDIGF